MITNVHVFDKFSILDLSLLLNAVFLTGFIHWISEGSNTKLGWWSVSLLVLAYPVSFILYGFSGQNPTLHMSILAVTRVFMIAGLFCATSWLQQKRRAATNGKRGEAV